jgi:hypothetical protein
MRIFLDANVLFSASNRGSNIARLVELAVRDHVVLTCDLAHEEARRNIVLKRSQWSKGFDELQAAIQCVPTALFELPVELIEKDRPIICSAIHSGCDLLATGDKRHFEHLFEQTVQGVTVVSLVGLANRLISRNPGGL